MSYCSMHLTEYPFGTMCPECRLEQARDAQQELIELQREAQREAEGQREALIDSIREAEHRRLNPGNYQCPACKLMTLLDGASRCPVCRADVEPTYWPSVRAREQTAREAAAAAKKSREDAGKRACDAAVAIVTLGTTHTRELFDAAFQEATKKREAQGRLSRLLTPLPVPSTQYMVHFRHTTARSSEGRWIEQPILILGIVTLESGLQIGFKHYRFATPHEYIAVLRYLKTEYPQLPEIDQAIRGLQPFLDEDWPSGGASHPIGDSVPQDHAQALQRYREGATQGDPASQYELGRMHANGQGVPQDYAEALKWYRQAADQGDGQAQLNIGVMYAYGQAVAQDHEEELKWYRQAADRGVAQAQRNIGWMYTHGQVVAQNYAEARKWYRKAADQGHADAMCSVGQMYHKGQGVAQDNQEALRWFRKAADQGHAGGQFYIDLIGGKFDR